MRYTTREAAKYLGISLYYLRNLRQGMYEDPGPKFQFGDFPNGPACFYEQSELDSWGKLHPWRKKSRRITHNSLKLDSNVVQPN